MRPARPIHSLSSLHRERGGLRRLNFFIDRAAEWSGERSRSSIRVLVLGWEQGGIALPFASEGYDVTVIDPDVTTIQAAAATAGEFGVGVEFIHGSVSALRERTFDIIAASFTTGSSHVFSSFRDLSAQLAPDGRLLLSVPRRGDNAQWSRFQFHLRQSGWRLRDAVPASGAVNGILAVLQRLGIARGSATFHALDALDNAICRIWPLRLAGGWLADLEACDPTKPFVMHLLPTLGIGGTEKLVYELVARLPRHGFEAKAVAMIDGGPLEKMFREQNLPLDVIVRRDPLGISTLRDLSRLFFLQRPEVVHTHLFGADAWGRLAAFWQGVPVIISTEHNLNPSYGMVKRLVNRVFALWTDAFVAVSETVKRVMIETDGVSPKKIRTIMNGTDLSAVVPRGGHPFHDIPRLIAVGRFYPQKDHATLLKALALVKRPWRLQLVGAGPLEGELRALAERLHIAARVEWLGRREDVSQLLARSDIFCFPSRWEGLGLVALEAAAAGVPVIASDLAPLREIFSDADITYVPPADVPAWARAIEKLLEDPIAAVAKTSRAMAQVRARASIDRMVADYADLYHDCLKKQEEKL